jgi:hypothetical protein
MIASMYGNNPTSQRVIVAGSHIQCVGASERRPHRCPLCALQSLSSRASRSTAGSSPSLERRDRVTIAAESMWLARSARRVSARYLAASVRLAQGGAPGLLSLPIDEAPLFVESPRLSPQNNEINRAVIARLQGCAWRPQDLKGPCGRAAPFAARNRNHAPMAVGTSPGNFHL